MKFKSEIQLNKNLALKGIINQTDVILTDKQTELLALGLNYILNNLLSTDSKVATEKSETYHAFLGMLKYTGQMNRRLQLCNTVSGKKGHLPHAMIDSYLNSTSSSPLQTMSWITDAGVLQYMERYYGTVLNKSKSVAAADIATTSTNLELLKAADSLGKQDHFFITKSDKGGVIVLWKRSDYEKEAVRQLSDESKYHLLAEESSSNRQRQSALPLSVQNTIHSLCQKRNTHIRHLENNGYISLKESLAMQVIDDKQKLPYVYFQAKIHKPFHPDTGTFQSRAIVATGCGPLYSLDKYLSKITSPIMAFIPGLLKNSNQLIERIATMSSSANVGGKHGVSCKDGHSSHHIGFATADVVALFPSIGVEEGLLASNEIYSYYYPKLCNHFQQRHLLPPVDPKTFSVLMKFLFDNSFLSYQNRRFYKQKNGTPMGGCISVFYANAFMYKLTMATLRNPPSWLILNQRFIDDFCFLYCSHHSHGTNLIDNYLKEISTENVKCEQVPCHAGEENTNGETSALILARTCHVLDVTLSFNHVTSTFESKPYMKEFAVPSYIHRTSNHPKQVFYNVPISQFNRLKSLSSSNETYKEACKKVTSQLIIRGYSKLECFVAQKRVDKRQLLSAFSRIQGLAAKRVAKKKAHFSFYVNAKFNPRTDWKKAQECVNEIHNYIGKHYTNSKNKSALLNESKSKIVFVHAQSKMSGVFNRKFKHGL